MSIQFDFPEDYLKKLTSKSFEEVARKMEEKAAPVLVESTKKAMRAVVQHEGDSEMINSVKASKPATTKTDAVILTVNPKGYSNHTFSRKNKGGKTRKYRVSNALKAIWLQYGVAGRQPPRDWLNKSVHDAEKKVNEIMQKVWEEEVGE